MPTLTFQDTTLGHLIRVTSLTPPLARWFTSDFLEPLSQRASFRLLLARGIGFIKWGVKILDDGVKRYGSAMPDP